MLGAVLGFLFMYLNTRLILTRFFMDVERILSGEEKAVQQKLERGQSMEIRSALKDSSSGGNFVQQALSQRRTLSVQDALDLMRDALYRPGGKARAPSSRRDAVEHLGKSGRPSTVPSGCGLRSTVRRRRDDLATDPAKDNARCSSIALIALNVLLRRASRFTKPDSADDDLAKPLSRRSTPEGQLRIRRSSGSGRTLERVRHRRHDGLGRGHARRRRWCSRGSSSSARCAAVRSCRRATGGPRWC